MSDYGTSAEEMYEIISSPEGDGKTFTDTYDLFDRN